MITLGDIEEAIKKDKNLTIVKYFENCQSVLMKNYPVCYLIIKRIILSSDPEGRPSLIDLAKIG